jgi:hypothetical protein
VIAGDIPDLPNYVADGSLKVHAPTSVVFVCGGAVEPNAPIPKSLRDAFLRIAHKTILLKYDVRRAEEMEWAFPKGGEYAELVEFESDIAQISDLIVLFSENAGSLAELGAFTKDDEIASRMLVFVDNENYANPSFIKLGLLDYLMRRYGNETVFVLQLGELKIPSITELDTIDLNSLTTLSNGPLTFHLKVKKLEPRTFDKTRNGHVTKLITGLIQHYAALTLDEIDTLLYCLGVPTPQQEIKKHLNCAELFGWVLKERAGFQTYFAAIEGNRALHFDFDPKSERLDRSRWNTEIVAYWRDNDPDRFSSIQAALKRAKK